MALCATDGPLRVTLLRPLEVDFLRHLLSCASIEAARLKILHIVLVILFERVKSKAAAVSNHFKRGALIFELWHSGFTGF